MRQPNASETVRQRRGARTRARRSWLFVFACTFASVLVVSPAALAQARHAASSGPVGVDFYRGRTVRLIDPGTTGGPIDVFARAIAPYLATYLHATVDIVSAPGNDTVTGQDELAAAQPNGLTVGMLNPLTDATFVILHEAGLNFNPEHEAYVASTGSTTYVLFANPASADVSVAALRKSRTPTTILTESAGTTNVILRGLVGMLGLDAHWISGYASPTDLIAGFLRGDGAVAMSSLTLSGPMIPAGKARPIAITLLPPVDTLYRQYLIGLPTIASLARSYPPKTRSEERQLGALETLNHILGIPLAMPTAVAPDRLAAMRAAAVWAFAQPGFRRVMLENGLNPNLVPPLVAKQSYISMLAQGATLRALLGAPG